MRRLRVTAIGEYIRYRSCQRRFALAEQGEKQLSEELYFFSRYATISLDPVLREEGKKREVRWEDSLKARNFQTLSQNDETSWQNFTKALSKLNPNENAYCREVSIEAEVGDFILEGRIDFILLLWREGKPYLRVVECKASRRDRTYHRIQVAAYHRMLEEILTTSPLLVGEIEIPINNIEVCVVRIADEGNTEQDMVLVEAIDSGTLALLRADVEGLLAVEGPFCESLAGKAEDLEYQLDERCNDCFFAIYCFPESARLGKLELLGLAPGEVRLLKEEGLGDIKSLAAIDLKAPKSKHLAQSSGLDLEALKLRALARTATLPGAEEELPQTQAVRGAEVSLLPEHAQEGLNLIRIYLAIDYDYAENRLGALSAHVTTSEGRLSTFPVKGQKGKVGVNEVFWENHQRQLKPLSNRHSRDVVAIVPKPGWQDDFEADSALEKETIVLFFKQLLDAIENVAQGVPEAPLHFYVWEQTEIHNLIDACMRLDSKDEGLLRSLSNLLSSREHAEQIIFSSLKEEMQRRFATGFTGTGLLVASSLNWDRKGKYQDRFYWSRDVLSQSIPIAQNFAQDLFDFQAHLGLTDDKWDPWGKKYLFEIRGRFQQNLTAPYLRAYWGQLQPPPPDNEEESKRLRSAIKKYWDAARPRKYLETFLSTRVQALRWLEERMYPYNLAIEKPRIPLLSLREFSLEVQGVAGAAIDFLRLDQQAKIDAWLNAHLTPPLRRVALKRSLALTGAHALDGNLIEARIDSESSGQTLAELRETCNFSSGSFVRLTPASDDLERGQTIKQLLFGGKTAVVEEIDWEEGLIRLASQFAPGSAYTLTSIGTKPDWPGFTKATLDESPSDFVAGAVEKRLLASSGNPIIAWLDPTSPNPPPQTQIEISLWDKLEKLISKSFIKRSDGSRQALAPDQQKAILDGLQTRLQLLQGPPGTGKTQTTAASVLLRILARLKPGDVVLLAANTHIAVNTLLERIDSLRKGLGEAAKELDLELPPLALAKIKPGPGAEGEIDDLEIDKAKGWIKAQGEKVLLIGGTTSGTLKLAKKLNTKREGEFRAQLLILDEASMMVFPHFLALATILAPEGELMLSGDHRQLSPIVAHDWSREDRVPLAAYTPFASAYEAVRALVDSGRLSPSQALRSALSYSFRLPPEVLALIHPVYRRDDIELEGRQGVVQDTNDITDLKDIWREGGVYLVVHDERESQKSNETETLIIEELLQSAPKSSLTTGSIGIVTPHRAQRTLLKERLSPFFGPVDVIDTVERLQGGERGTIFVSACASDPAAISTRAEFLLDLNRANVAFSRAKERLVVVVSKTLLDYVPAELELYESGLLWKALRAQCSRLILELSINRHNVRIYRPETIDP